MQRNLVLAILLLATAGFAAAAKPAQLPPEPPCLHEAATYHQTNPWILRAIVWHESRNNAATMVRNTNGTIDVGLGGTNSVHFDDLVRKGVAPRALLDGCTSMYVSAWLLRRHMNNYGNTWQAVGAYHSKTPEYNQRYADIIYGILVRWGITR